MPRVCILHCDERGCTQLLNSDTKHHLVEEMSRNATHSKSIEITTAAVDKEINWMDGS